MKPNFISLSRTGAITSKMTKEEKAEDSHWAGPGSWAGWLLSARFPSTSFSIVSLCPALDRQGSPSVLGSSCCLLLSPSSVFACCAPFLPHFSLFPFSQLSSLPFSPTLTGVSNGPASKKMNIPTNPLPSSPYLHCPWGRISTEHWQRTEGIDGKRGTWRP